MIKHTVGDDVFNLFKERFNKIAQDNYNGIDERIIPTLKVMAGWSDVVSVWSCSGHTPEETKPNKRFINQQRRYVIFVSNNPGTPILNYFNEFIQATPDSDWILTRPFLKALQLKGGAIGTEKRLNHWTLEFNYLYNSKHPEKDPERLARIDRVWDEMFKYVDNRLNPTPYTLEERLQILRDKFGGDNEFINHWSQVPEGQDPKETHHVLDRQGIPRFKEI